MTEERGLVQSVVRSLDILELLNREPAAGVSQIAGRLGLDKSTVHRLLTTLRAKGYVRQDPDTQSYSNSLKLLELGLSSVDRKGLMRKARPHLETLAAATRETVNLALLDGVDIVYVDKIESTEVIRADLGVGRSWPAYATSLGKAILSHLPEERVQSLFRNEGFAKLTANTLDSLEELLTDLRTTRRRGYAIDNEELLPGLACVAAAVTGFSGEPLGAVSVAYPRYRYQQGSAAEQRIIEAVATTARDISHELGHTGAAFPTGT